MSEILHIARKELWGFFASPVAYLFLGAFLAANLFVFFWVDAFFARNLADVRPLFDGMPILLIFLSAALTMRLWSEERRSGTLELLLTLPQPPLRLVLGKFIGALGLMSIALVLTLPLPLTVAFLGPLDWGPVFGGYLASLLLAAAYLAIGLFVSARTDNPIVSLIGTTLICGVFYLLGSQTLTGLFGYGVGEWLKLLGTGSRFASITRGVIDLRDLAFYLSLVGVFLTLTVYSLESLRWAGDRSKPELRRRWAWTAGLVSANFLAINLWLQPLPWARLDLTQGQIYSLSQTTRDLLAQLREPLLIRGYFSAKTHPLLAPLVPQLRDLVREYAVAGRGKVRVEFVDPLEHPDLEREAGERYGIRPVAFQTADKYQEAVVNSYFDLLVQYGDEYETLSFRDLIELKAESETDLEVRLRNPEYDLTRAIKKVVYGYRGGGDPFQSLTKPVVFHGYLSEPDRLPGPLHRVRTALEAVLSELADQSKGKFRFELQDPDAGDGTLARTIRERFGFQPITLDLLDLNPFYFYMVLESGGETVPVPLPESLDRASLKRAIETGLRRFVPGVLKTIALYTPPPTGLGAPNPYTDLQDHLQDQANLRETDLRSGRVPEGTDLLLVVGPEHLDEKQVFALDQFLMQGGTVILAASPYRIDLGGRAIAATKSATGLEDWLEHLGVCLDQSLVLDPQNTPFPIPVQRQIGGFVVEEIQTLPYPYFPDIRPDGMDRDTGMVSGLGQITLNWVSPLVLDTETARETRTYPLLWSSPDSWTSPSENIQPDPARYGPLGFPLGEPRERHLLAAALEGGFTSYFAGKPSPLLKAADGDQEAGQEADRDAGTEAEAAEAAELEDPMIASVVETAPTSARLILIGSSTFLTDTAIDLASEATRTRYTKPLELIQNMIDWALDDRGLLTLRGRSQYSRLLRPLDRTERIFWESLNDLLAVLGLALVYGLYRRNARARRRQAQALLAGRN